MGLQGLQDTKETEDKEVNQINAYPLFKNSLPKNIIASSIYKIGV